MSQEKESNTMEVFKNLCYEDKIKMLSEDPTVLAFPLEVSYVAQYMAQFRPQIPPCAGFDNETSLDIIDTLSAVCTIDANTVSRVLFLLGYRLYFSGIYVPEWSMIHIDHI